MARPNSRPNPAAGRRRAQAIAQSRRRIAVGGLSASWAERHQLDVLVGDFRLVHLARLRHPAAFWWWGVRLVEGVNGAWCYLCERHIATWARRWPMTDQASVAITDHRDQVHNLAAPPCGSDAPPSQDGGDREQEPRS